MDGQVCGRRGGRGGRAGGYDDDDPAMGDPVTGEAMMTMSTMAMTMMIGDWLSECMQSIAGGREGVRVQDNTCLALYNHAQVRHPELASCLGLERAD